MSNNDSFISEVNEEVRRDRMFQWLRRYGILVLLGLIAVVGGAALLEWSESSARASAEVDGDALRAAQAEADPVKRAESLGALVASAPDAAPVIRMAQAGSLIEAGKAEEAAAVLAQVADDGTAAQVYRSLAALQRVMVLGPKMDLAERRATIETLAAEDGPFQPLALEQRALLHLETGDKAAALRDLGAVLGMPNAPEQLVSRARQLLVAAGGSLPGPAAPSVTVSGG